MKYQTAASANHSTTPSIVNLSNTCNIRLQEGAQATTAELQPVTTELGSKMIDMKRGDKPVKCPQSELTLGNDGLKAGPELGPNYRTPQENDADNKFLNSDIRYRKQDIQKSDIGPEVSSERKLSLVQMKMDDFTKPGLKMRSKPIHSSVKQLTPSKSKKIKPRPINSPLLSKGLIKKNLNSPGRKAVKKRSVKNLIDRFEAGNSYKSHSETVGARAGTTKKGPMDFFYQKIDRGKEKPDQLNPACSSLRPESDIADGSGDLRE